MKKTIFYIMLFVFILNGNIMSNAERTKDFKSVTETNQDDYYKMTGSIGQYPIVMYLDPVSARKGRSCGYYYYRNKPNSKFKLVAQTVKNSGRTVELTLYEYTPAGKHSGSFVGAVYMGVDACVFAGTFYNSKAQSFHFRVEERSF